MGHGAWGTGHEARGVGKKDENKNKQARTHKYTNTQTLEYSSRRTITMFMPVALPELLLEGKKGYPNILIRA